MDPDGMSLRANPAHRAGHPGRTGLSLNRSHSLAARGEQQIPVAAACEPSHVGATGLKVVGAEPPCKIGRAICLEISFGKLPETGQAEERILASALG